MWNRAEVNFIDTHELAWELSPDTDFGGQGGGTRRLLSVDREYGASSAVVRIRNQQQGVLKGGADLFMLSGRGLMNSVDVGVNSYIHVPPGGLIDFKPAPEGAVLFAGHLASSELLPGKDGPPPHIVDPETLSWESPHWSADSPLQPGAAVKFLNKRQNCHVYLAAMFPGWLSKDEEWHPQTEESFRLYGDLLMGSRGITLPGTYMFRLAHEVHGPLYTRFGSLSLIRSEGPTTTEYRAPAPGHTWREIADDAYAGFKPPAI
jgi:hypothetical protein